MSLGEYKVVERNTSDLDRLKFLAGIRLDQTQAALLATELLATFNLPPVNLSFTGRTDRGHYHWEDRRVVVRKDDISAWVLVHELAHHWVHTKMGGKSGQVHRPYHGTDFITRLDRLAEVAEILVDGFGYQ